MTTKEGRPVDDEATQAFGGVDDNSNSLMLTLDEILVKSARETIQVIQNVSFSELGARCVKRTEQLLQNQSYLRKLARVKALPHLIS